jgi:hypothetical protein
VLSAYLEAEPQRFHVEVNMVSNEAMRLLQSHCLTLPRHKPRELQELVQSWGPPLLAVNEHGHLSIELSNGAIRDIFPPDAVERIVGAAQNAS